MSRNNELVPNESTDLTADDVTLTARQLNEGDLTHVYLSEIDHPELMFVIRTDQHDRLVTGLHVL